MANKNSDMKADMAQAAEQLIVQGTKGHSGGKKEVYSWGGRKVEA